MQKNKYGNRCVIYARYSCHNQTEQSIEGQLADCEKFAEKQGLQIVNRYIDRALTATTDKRPQFQQMIKDSAKELFDVVLVWKLDRFARNRYDSAVYKRRLKNNGVRVMSVMENISDSPEGVLMESVLEGFAEYFSRDLAQKVLRGMHETAKKHKITGAIPFGYMRSPENTYIPDERAVPAVRKMFEMYLAGESKTDIANYLNAHGYHTSYGNPFTRDSITPLMRNTRYVGRYTYDGVEFADENQRIIDDETFNKVQLQIKANKRTGSMRRAKERYLLTGKIYCGYCKSHMHGESGRSGDGKTKHYYYMCTGRKKQHICTSKSIKKDAIESYVLNAIKSLINNSKIIERIADAIIKRQEHSADNSDIAIMEKQLAEVNRKLKNVMTAIEDGIITGTTHARLKELEAQQSQIQYDIDVKRSQRVQFSKAQIIDFFNDLNIGADATWQEKQILIKELVNRVYLWSDKIVIIFNFASTPCINDDTDEAEIERIIKTAITESSAITVSGSPHCLTTEQIYFSGSLLFFISWRYINSRNG